MAPSTPGLEAAWGLDPAKRWGSTSCDPGRGHGRTAPLRPPGHKRQQVHGQPVGAAGEDHGGAALRSEPRPLGRTGRRYPHKLRRPAGHATGRARHVVELAVHRPGQTWVTTTPVPSRSARNASLKPSTKCLLAEYAAEQGITARPAPDPMLSTPPRPRSTTRGPRRRSKPATATTLVASTWRVRPPGPVVKGLVAQPGVVDQDVDVARLMVDLDQGPSTSLGSARLAATMTTRSRGFFAISSARNSPAGPPDELRALPCPLAVRWTAYSGPSPPRPRSPLRCCRPNTSAALAPQLTLSQPPPADAIPGSETPLHRTTPPHSGGRAATAQFRSVRSGERLSHRDN